MENVKLKLILIKLYNTFWQGTFLNLAISKVQLRESQFLFPLKRLIKLHVYTIRSKICRKFLRKTKVISFFFMIYQE